MPKQQLLDAAFQRIRNAELILLDVIEIAERKNTDLLPGLTHGVDEHVEYKSTPWGYKLKLQPETRAMAAALRELGLNAEADRLESNQLRLLATSNAVEYLNHLHSLPSDFWESLMPIRTRQR